MWRPAYKQRCLSCKKNMVLIRHPRQRAICSECQARSLGTPVTDPKFQKLFDIDPDLYTQSSFLRDVRYQYGRFGSLSEKQIAAFDKVVKELTNRKAQSIVSPENLARIKREGGPAPASPGPPARPPPRVVRRELDPFGRSHAVIHVLDQFPAPVLEEKPRPKKASKPRPVKAKKSPKK